MADCRRRAAEAVDNRSAIFSLGATLYHMVTGRAPFKSVTAAGRETEELALAWPQDLNPKLSDGVCLVIAKMMAKRPEDRYQTPRQLLDALESLTRDR